jgi:hypothetical protein
MSNSLIAHLPQVSYDTTDAVPPDDAQRCADILKPTMNIR